MHIYLIHGDYSQKSEERLQKYIAKAREKDWEIVIINLPLKNEPLDLEEILSSQTLFAKKRFFVIEHIKFISRKEISWLKRNSENLNGNLLLYSDSQVNESLINSFPLIKKVEEYKLPTNIFKFLDSFFPGNCKNCLVMLHRLVANESVEFIFALLAKQLRDLYWVKESPSNIPYPSWRVNKLERQAAKFPLKLIREQIADLADIDIKIKTSRGNILDYLDLLLLKKLK